MKNLEQRIAEINYRSEKILKKQKKRRTYILRVCIPLVLCITLFSAFSLRNTKTALQEEPGGTNPVMNGLTEDQDENSAVSVLTIEVSGLGFSQTYMDAADVMLISDQLCSYDLRTPECSGAASEVKRDENYKWNTNTEDDNCHIADSATTGYTITLIMEDGSKSEYYFSGNTLQNLTRNQTSLLTQKQADELEDMLGITLP